MTGTIELSEDIQKLVPVIDALSRQERARLACYLIDSLDDDVEDDPAEIRAAWAKEIRRRVEEIKSGKVEGIPADEVFRKMREKYP
jgi:putative addiction module component (TIGR02574 family)